MSGHTPVPVTASEPTELDEVTAVTPIIARLSNEELASASLRRTNRAAAVATPTAGHVHHALVCEPALLATLGDLTSLAIGWRDRDPLQRFWMAHRARFRAFDRVCVPRDRGLAARLFACIARLESGPYASADSVQQLVAEMRWLPKHGRVSQPAQRALGTMVACLEAAIARLAPLPVVAEECHFVRQALASLDTCTMHAPLAVAASATFREMMAACAVIGMDGDIGVGRLDTFPVGDGTLCAGKPLYAIPYIDATARPPQNVFARTLTTFGHYSAAGANQLYADDARGLCGPFLVKPTWASGEQLSEAASYARATAALLDAIPKSDAGDELSAQTLEHEILAAALATFRDHALAAKHAGHAVLEWVDGPLGDLA